MDALSCAGVYYSTQTIRCFQAIKVTELDKKQNMELNESDVVIYTKSMQKPVDSDELG